MAAYEVLLLNTAIPQIQAAQSGDTYVVPRDIAFSAALTLSAGTANGVPYLNGSKVLTTGSALQFDGSNLGLGVTPSAWGSVFKSIDINETAVSGTSGGALVQSGNAVFNGSSWVYKVNGSATRVELNAGTAGATWHLAASGTAGSAISFIQAMTLDASGNLGVGVTSVSSSQSASAKVIGICDPTTANLSSLRLSSGATFSSGTRMEVFVTGAYNAIWGETNHPLVFATNNTERARITSAGDWGVGTLSPKSYLNFRTATISGTNGGIIDLTDAANIVLGEIVGDSGGLTLSAAVNVLAFRTGNSERARITSGGDFLVGTTNDSGTAGAGFKTLSGRPVVVNAASADTTTIYEAFSTGAAAYRFYVGLGGTVYATNTTISAISDQRLKENICDLDVGLNAVLALKPRKFDWKTGKGKDKKDDRGFIAQEFEQVFPDLIDTWKDPAPEGEEPYKSVRADLIPVLVKAIQEQQAMINELKAEVAALKGA